MRWGNAGGRLVVRAGWPAEAVGAALGGFACNATRADGDLRETAQLCTSAVAMLGCTSLGGKVCVSFLGRGVVRETAQPCTQFEIEGGWEHRWAGWCNDNFGVAPPRPRSVLTRGARAPRCYLSLPLREHGQTKRPPAMPAAPELLSRSRHRGDRLHRPGQARYSRVR